MGSDSPSLRLRRVLVVEALPDTDGTGPERLGVTSNIPKAPVPNSCPIRRRTPVNQSQPELTFRRTQGKPPGHRTPRTRLPSWSSARRCWVGRQVNCEKPATGAVSSRFSSQLPSFASVRRPSGVTLSCGQAGNTPERPGSRVGKRVGLTATVTATWLRRDRSAVNLSVQLAPSTDCHGLWDRPGPDLRICECVVTAVLGGLPSGSVPVVSGDLLRIWPRKRVPFI
jgi:hypothetical protein